jgi:hypothetical protein
MSAAGRKAAQAYGKKLPAFRNVEEATSSLIEEKNQLLAKLGAQGALVPELILDFSVDSLLRFERWYFEQVSRSSSVRPASAADVHSLAECAALYFGEVVVRSLPGSVWVVEEFVFEPGRFEIGVRNGNCTMMLESFYAKLHHRENYNRDSMWRTYQHYFACNPDVQIRF